MSDTNHEELILELDQKLDFQEKQWFAERVAFVLLAAIVVLGILGMFGTGPLSSTTAETADHSLVVDYERFVRHNGQASLDITVSPDQVSDGQVQLWISSDYLSDMQINRISPQPDEERAEGNRQVFVFMAENPDEPISITLSFRPDTFGRLSGDLGISGGDSVSFSQISYP